MAPHQERVVAEKEDLQKKVDALDAFIYTNPTFTTLPEDEQDRLRRQYDHMAAYNAVLNERIAAFPACQPGESGENGGIQGAPVRQRVS